MREIKFRAWDESKMIYDNDKVFSFYFSSELPAVTGPAEVTNKGASLWVYETRLKNAADRHFDHTSIVPVTEIMQFTGLKDKNGKPVFEGDVIEAQIIETPSIPTMGKIVFDNEHLAYGNENLAGVTLLMKLRDIKVIGNIYENPELLERIKP